MTVTPPPSPEGTADAAAFMAGLRRLKTWSGLSFRQLERRASAAGDVLPYSTASTMLGRDRLPREELLVTFLRACGLDDEAALPWVTAHAAIALTDRPAMTTPAPRHRAESGTTTISVSPLDGDLSTVPAPALPSHSEADADPAVFRSAERDASAVPVLPQAASGEGDDTGTRPGRGGVKRAPFARGRAGRRWAAAVAVVAVAFAGGAVLASGVGEEAVNAEQTVTVGP